MTILMLYTLIGMRIPVHTEPRHRRAIWHRLPSQSRDLNPIEHVWNAIGRRTSGRNQSVLRMCVVPLWGVWILLPSCSQLCGCVWNVGAAPIFSKVYNSVFSTPYSKSWYNLVPVTCHKRLSIDRYFNKQVLFINSVVKQRYEKYWY